MLIQSTAHAFSSPGESVALEGSERRVAQRYGGSRAPCRVRPRRTRGPGVSGDRRGACGGRGGAGARRCGGCGLLAVGDLGVAEADAACSASSRRCRAGSAASSVRGWRRWRSPGRRARRRARGLGKLARVLGVGEEAAGGARGGGSPCGGRS